MKKHTPAEKKSATKSSEHNQSIPKKSKTRLAKRKGVNSQRQRKTLQIMASGESVGAAMAKAGYSPYYVHNGAHQFLKRPLVQSLFTEEIRKALEGKNKAFGAMVAPYIDALDAQIIVKSTTEGIACVAKDLFTQEVLPDHRIRMEAADKLIALHGGVPKEVDMPKPPQPGMTIIIARDQAKVQIQQAGMDQAKAAKVEATGTVTAPGMPNVTIRKA